MMEGEEGGWMSKAVTRWGELAPLCSEQWTNGGEWNGWRGKGRQQRVGVRR